MMSGYTFSTHDTSVFVKIFKSTPRSYTSLKLDGSDVSLSFSEIRVINVLLNESGTELVSNTSLYTLSRMGAKISTYLL